MLYKIFKKNNLTTVFMLISKLSSSLFDINCNESFFTSGGMPKYLFYKLYGRVLYVDLPEY